MGQNDLSRVTLPSVADGTRAQIFKFELIPFYYFIVTFPPSYSSLSSILISYFLFIFIFNLVYVNYIFLIFHISYLYSYLL